VYLRTRSRLHVAGIGYLDQQPASLPRVTRFVFRNQNGTTSAAANCCLICRTTLPDGRQAGSGFNLGVGQGGTASNGMEMQLFLSGHRSGLEYDVVRTRRDSMWERRGGVWTRLEIHPMGTSDDRFAADECLRPRNNRIFVVDRPGWPNIAVPAPNGTTWPGFNAGVATHADATEVFSPFSFAEWVIVRSPSEGLPWTRVELPALRDGTRRRFIFWHSITWLTRDALNQWVVDPARSRIRLGALPDAVLTTAPTP
jgi:hypothetical protein